MRITTFRLWIAFDRATTQQDAQKIRGYLGNVFKDNPFAHHHYTDGSLVYLYPRLQYKTLYGLGLVMGFNEGAEIVKEIFEGIKEINFEGTIKEIINKGIECEPSLYGVSRTLHTYRFITPWIALNESNYEQYNRLGTWQQKRHLLQKILIGNVLSMSKGIGYTVPIPLIAKIKELKEHTVTVKDTKLLGFTGSFAINFDIPNYWGLGKSVSRGFGTVLRL